MKICIFGFKKCVQIVQTLYTTKVEDCPRENENLRSVQGQSISKYAITISGSFFLHSCSPLFSCLSKAPNIIFNKGNSILASFN